jgi:hypothetical protein
MFAGKVRSLPEGKAPEWLGQLINNKQLTRLERLARRKHSSLFAPLINYGSKKIQH